MTNSKRSSKYVSRCFLVGVVTLVRCLQELDSLLLEWGDMQYHAPVLLAWTVVKFVARSEDSSEHTRLLGDRALQANVFGYLSDMLDSPFFTGDRPVSNICKSIVQVLLANCVTAFNESSLGDPKILIAVATKSLSHPRLCLEFWEKGLDQGVGILLSSALRRFPLDLTSVLHFLEPLATVEVSSQEVFKLLCRVQNYTDDFTHVSPHSVDVGREAGSWVITKPLPLYPVESRHPNLPAFVLPVGTEGVVLLGGDELGAKQIISWHADYSAWELFGLITVSVLHSPGVGIDLAPSALVEGVAAIAKLVTQVLKHDWSLEEHLRPITSQYFTLLHKFSTLPHPPCLLLAECLKCMSVMAGNEPRKVWEQLSRTGFLPRINFSPSSIELISVAPGHYGQLMNSWERPRGIYPVSMAMLDLLLSGFPPEGCPALGDALACVVLVMREMFAGSHSWRYRHSANRDQIGHKLLQLCHMILSSPQSKTDRGYSVVEFVQHFLLHSAGTHSLLSTLSLSLDTVNSLYSSRLSVSSPVLQVEALKLAFQVIDLLLQSKKDPSPTPLEQALATQSVKRKVDSHSIPTPIHLVAVIASYIHHHDDPHVPAGATKLLTRLSQVAPMSVFACLGSDAMIIRDAFVHRLKSHVEDVELKVAILELVTECVSSQPGMMELFLKIQPASAKTAQSSKAAYVLGEESCLHVVMQFIDHTKKTPPLLLQASLLQASLLLLRSLWVGRHDAALIALRAQKDFWKNLTHPLLKPVQEGVDTDFLSAAHAMFIVALEVYNILKDKMDDTLVKFFDEFSLKKCYEMWMKRLRALPSSADSASQGQLQTAQAWSTLLCVGASHDELFHLVDPKLRVLLIENLLSAITSQLSPPLPSPPSQNTPPPPSPVGILIADELSVLSVVLMKKWADKNIQFGVSVVQSFIAILSSCSGLDVGVSSSILISVYSGIVQLLSVKREQERENNGVQDSGADVVDPKCFLDLISCLEETFKNHSLYLRLDSKQRPDILAVYALNELAKYLLSSSSNAAMCLEVLRQHSVVSVLGALLGEHLRLATDLEFVSAVFGFFISLSCSKSGSEALMTNRISHHINISLANTLSLNLKEWAGTWCLSLQLMSSLLDLLTHQFIGHALDFVGVYQERLIQALDIYHVILDLASLEETRCVCYFLFRLSLFKQQWQFAMPSLHSDLMERVVYLTGSAAAVVSRRSTLKQIVKTLNAAGLLAPEDGPLGRRRQDQGGVANRREASPRPTLSWAHKDKVELDDAWVTSSSAFTKLQDGLISILTSCLATLRHYCPPLGPMVMEGGVDLVEFIPLFALSLAPPTIQLTTPPSLATLTTCLSTGVDLLNKLDPSRANTPSRSPIKSPSINRSPAALQKRAEYLRFLEQAVVVLLSQATRYLVDPGVSSHDKMQLKKELANELGNFTTDLLRNFTRKGAPSPVRPKLSVPSRGHTYSLQDSFSGKGSSLSFSDASEQAIFKVADSFSKQFFR